MKQKCSPATMKNYVLACCSLPTSCGTMRESMGIPSTIVLPASAMTPQLYRKPRLNC